MNIDPSSDWWDVATAVGTIGAAVFAAVAAGVSAWSARASVKAAEASEGMVALERERLEDERRRAGRAHVLAEPRKRYSNASGGRGISMFVSETWWLEVWNEGPAKATAVGVFCEREGFILDRTQLPTDLKPGQRVRLDVDQTGDLGYPLITIEWTDELGEQDQVTVVKQYLPEGG